LRSDFDVLSSLPDHSNVTFPLFIVPRGSVIGGNVFSGPNVTLLNMKYPRKGKLSQVKIGNGVIMGASSVIGPGLTIGSYSVIGYGSVVTCDIPPGEVWIGNPARFHMTKEEYLEKK